MAAHTASAVAVMRRHIDELLVPYMRQDIDDALQVHFLPSTRGACVIRNLDGTVLEIRLPRIRSVISYAVALHEIGHIRGRYQRSRNVMVRERWAWQWARENAPSWSPAMERVAAKSLSNQAWRALHKKGGR
jgi:hypothetical protein